MDSLMYNSVETFAVESKVVFTTDTTTIFNEDKVLNPIPIGEKGLSYMPWGEDNKMPYGIIDKIEKDETLATCQMFNAEVCYGAGLRYNTDKATAEIQEQIEDFFLLNNMAAYYLGVCQDFKYFGWAVTVLFFNQEHTQIVAIDRKEAAYCRFTPKDPKTGRIEEVLYADWQNYPDPHEEGDIERIPLLDWKAPLRHLQELQTNHKCPDKVAIVTRIPTVNSTYYPIPYYGALFRSKWYDIKQAIAVAKKAKLENSAPIKYHIEISERYWDRIFHAEGITDLAKRKERVTKEKKNIIDFLTGKENAGKVLFSQFYFAPDGKEEHDVLITKVDDSKEGGDWETDIQEAINIVCFTMRVHSNLVGSVPGKAQTNNSGSDKRELYTIAQALQKPYHDLLFLPHLIIIYINKWKGAIPECPFVMLTTLDEHKDAKEVVANPPTE